MNYYTKLKYANKHFPIGSTITQTFDEKHMGKISKFILKDQYLTIFVEGNNLEGSITVDIERLIEEDKNE